MARLFKGGLKPETYQLLFFLFVTIAGSLAFILSPTLLPSALISVLIFFIFSPTVDSMERKGLSRSLGIGIIFLALGTTCVISFQWMTPRISKEIESFQTDSGKVSSLFRERLQAHEKAILGKYTRPGNRSFTDKALTWIGTTSDAFVAWAPNLFSQLLTCLLLVPFLSFILLKDGREIRRALLRMVPNRYFETVYSLSSQILEEMGGYVSARIVEAALVGFLVMLGCLVFKVPYAFLLAAAVAVTNPIPYLGPVIGAIPGILLAILDPQIENQLVLVLIVCLIANIVDMVLIFPLVVAKIVDLHPAIVIVSVILGSQLFGILGMIIAVPITSIVKIFIQELYSRLYHFDKIT